LTTASTVVPLKFRDNRFLQWICIATIVAFALAAYHPDKIFDWALENGLVFCSIPVLIFTYRRFAFSDLSYLLIFLYLCIHEFGAHYKYSDVPLGEWIKPLLHTQRNHYDRIAHFSFGFMIAYPFREVAMRSLGVRGRWLYYLPVETTLALSAIYEILEALMANILTPERGEEFVGMQGDMWDSQEDMFMAALGSIVAVSIIAAVVARRKGRAERDRAAVYAVSSK
jgi:putative membrane protein